jgi:PEP-CTERM motif
MQDLNALIDPLDPLKGVTTLVSARDINSVGQIVGFGIISGKNHAFLVTPVPEPETYAMMVAGLGLLGFMLRRRRRQPRA